MPIGDLRWQRRVILSEDALPESVKSVKVLLPIYPIHILFFTDSGLKRHRASRNPPKDKTAKNAEEP